MPRARRRGQADAQWQKVPLHPYVFIPDMDPATPGGLSDMLGFYPTTRGIRAQASLRLFATGPTEPTLGWYSTSFPGGQNYTYVGTKSHLWVLSGTGFVENDGGQLFTGASNPWTFATVGSYVIASNGKDPVQAITSAGGAFGVLAGSPPIASIVSAADPGGTGFFAFLFNLQSNPQGWACSAAGNPISWPLDTTNLSATGTLGLTPGPITAATPLRGGVVAFKNNSMYYGQFVGTPFVWQFVLVSENQGIAGPYAFASANDVVYFIGADNIYGFDGYSLNVVPNALAEWLIKRTMNANYASSTIGSYDGANDTVSFHFSSINASPAGTLDTKIMWNRRSGRWAVDHFSIQGGPQINLASQPGTTYAQMTTTYPTYASIAAGTTYAILAPGPSAFTASAIFGLDNNLYTFSGPARQTDTYFVTNDIGNDERLTSIYRARLGWSIFSINGSMSITGLGKDIAGQQANQLASKTAMGPRGFFDLRQTSRWSNLRFNVTGDCEITGYEILAADGGQQ